MDGSTKINIVLHFPNMWVSNTFKTGSGNAVVIGIIGIIERDKNLNTLRTCPSTVCKSQMFNIEITIRNSWV